MSASNVNNATAPRQVACMTLDKDEILVDLDVLLLSRMFRKMYDDLGLAEHDTFPGVFPVEKVSSRIFKKVIDWCTEHKDDPELVIEKDPVTQECKWFTLTEYDRSFFDVPMPELLELVTAADFLDIERLLHYACQSVAACIKGKSPREICVVLQQDCDVDHAQIRKALVDNPWLEWPGAFPDTLIGNAIFVPNQLLVTIFEKLPREDLERLQLVSTQFNDVIVSSSKLSELQGPLRVVAKVDLTGKAKDFGAHSHLRSAHGIEVWLPDGTRVTCPDFENLAKRLKSARVQKLRLDTTSPWYGGLSDADIEGLSALLPVKSAWKSATVKASMNFFLSRAPFEFVCTQLLLCKEIIILGDDRSFSWPGSYMRLPAIAACNKLDLRILYHYRIHPAGVVEWLEHEASPERKWSEPRQLILRQDFDFHGGIDGLLTALKTAFSASSSRKPYIVRIPRSYHRVNLEEVLVNETTHERLIIRARQNDEVSVERA
ncbi:Suppressor of kinetochore protein 1 [Aphelenchoides avenae]|nr:Suppressor of kinetochore protein 1 [Aphelenchus avenae]